MSQLRLTEHSPMARTGPGESGIFNAIFRGFTRRIENIFAVPDPSTIPYDSTSPHHAATRITPAQRLLLSQEELHAELRFGIKKYVAYLNANTERLASETIVQWEKVKSGFAEYRQNPIPMERIFHSQISQYLSHKRRLNQSSMATDVFINAMNILLEQLDNTFLMSNIMKITKETNGLVGQLLGGQEMMRAEELANGMSRNNQKLTDILVAFDEMNSGIMSFTGNNNSIMNDSNEIQEIIDALEKAYREENKASIPVQPASLPTLGGIDGIYFNNMVPAQEQPSLPPSASVPILLGATTTTTTTSQSNTRVGDAVSVYDVPPSAVPQTRDANIGPIVFGSDSGSDSE